MFLERCNCSKIANTFFAPAVFRSCEASRSVRPLKVVTGCTRPTESRDFQTDEPSLLLMSVDPSIPRLNNNRGWFKYRLAIIEGGLHLADEAAGGGAGIGIARDGPADDQIVSAGCN